MFSALGRFSNKYRYFILAGWVVLTAVMALAAPPLAEVGTTDQSQFLPEDTESTIARDLLDTKFAAAADEAESSVVIIVYNQAGLSEQDTDRARSLHDWLARSMRNDLGDPSKNPACTRCSPSLRAIASVAASV